MVAGSIKTLMRGSNLLSCHSKRSIEPLLKSIARLEYGRQEEIEQCPQLGKIVLRNHYQYTQHTHICTCTSTRIAYNNSLQATVNQPGFYSPDHNPNGETWDWGYTVCTFIPTIPMTTCTSYTRCITQLYYILYQYTSDTKYIIYCTSIHSSYTRHYTQYNITHNITLC